MIQTYKGYEIRIERVQCKNKSTFLTYDVSFGGEKIKSLSGSDFSACTMIRLYNAVKFRIDEEIDRRQEEYEYNEDEEYEIYDDEEDWEDEDLS